MYRNLSFQTPVEWGTLLCPLTECISEEWGSKVRLAQECNFKGNAPWGPTLHTCLPIIYVTPTYFVGIV
jgi:hypothetical protein